MSTPAKVGLSLAVILYLLTKNIQLTIVITVAHFILHKIF